MVVAAPSREATVEYYAHLAPPGADAFASDTLLWSLLQITQALTSELELDRAYGAILGVVKRVTGADRTSLLLVPEADGLAHGFQVGTATIESEEPSLVLAAGLGLPQGAEVGSRVPLANSVASWVLRTGEPLLLNGASHSEPEVQRLMRQRAGMSAICVPLLAKGHILGVLNASKLDTLHPFTEHDRNFLAVLAGQAAIALEHARLYARLVEQAAVDGLTGLLNHATFQGRLEAELERSNRTGQDLSLLMIDLDGFKLVNDTYGHPVGDRLLKLLAQQAIIGTIRPYDVACRPGGDEFAVILPHTTADQAVVVADRIRTAITACDTSVAGVPHGLIAASIGVAHYPTDGRRREDLVDVAENALYLAKYLGRDRVERGSSAISHFERDPRKLHDLLVDANTGTIEALAAAIDARDSYTSGHSRRVAEYALELAQSLGYADRFCHDLRLACLFHDVGKIGVPDAVLRKPGKLTDEEFDQMKSHPHVGSQMLERIRTLKHTLPGIRHHHERWDGKGYPDALAGEQIPEMARLISVADAYDAMTSNRVYRSALLHEDVMRIMRSGAGIQWDARMIEAWIALLGEKPHLIACPPLPATPAPADAA